MNFGDVFTVSDRGEELSRDCKFPQTNRWNGSLKNPTFARSSSLRSPRRRGDMMSAVSTAKMISITEPIAKPVKDEIVSFNGWAPLTRVARKIGRDPQTLKRWAKRGIVETKLIAATVYVRCADIEHMFSAT